MKNYLAALLSVLIFITSNNAKAELCNGDSKKLIASAFYHDKKYNLDINLGKFFTDNSKLIFEPNTDNYNNADISIKDDGKKIDTDKIIKEYKKNRQLKIKLKKQLTEILIGIAKNGNIDQIPSPKYLNIDTKEISYMKQKILIPTVCEAGFLKMFIQGIYTKYDILIITETNQ